MDLDLARISKYVPDPVFSRRGHIYDSAPEFPARTAPTDRWRSKLRRDRESADIQSFPLHQVRLTRARKRWESDLPFSNTAASDVTCLAIPAEVTYSLAMAKDGHSG